MRNTWACGPLKPDGEKTMSWSVTAVKSGPFATARIDAGLDGSEGRRRIPWRRPARRIHRHGLERCAWTQVATTAMTAVTRPPSGRGSGALVARAPAHRQAGCFSASSVRAPHRARIRSRACWRSRWCSGCPCRPACMVSPWPQPSASSRLGRLRREWHPASSRLGRLRSDCSASKSVTAAQRLRSFIIWTCKVCVNSGSPASSRSRARLAQRARSRAAWSSMTTGWWAPASASVATAARRPARRWRS